MPRLTKEGHVIVYDNGKDRPGNEFSRAHEFRVDKVNRTVETIWKHDFDYVTKSLGSVHKRDNQNVVVGHGAKGLIIEVNRAGEVLFEGKIKYFYRAYPIEFYHQSCIQ